jgi:primosomal protein N' (replication factor Y)
VAGRAGRGREPGTVILQTYAPEHHSIRYALTEDYLGFYREELPHREASRFPPFRQVASLLFTAPTAEKGEAAALAFRDRLLAADRLDPTDLLGPAPAPIPRINNQFRFQMLLRDHQRERLTAAIRAALATPLPTGVKVAVDLDPYFVL